MLTNFNKPIRHVALSWSDIAVKTELGDYVMPLVSFGVSSYQHRSFANDVIANTALGNVSPWITPWELPLTDKHFQAIESMLKRPMSNPNTVVLNLYTLRNPQQGPTQSSHVAIVFATTEVVENKAKPVEVPPKTSATDYAIPVSELKPNTVYTWDSHSGKLYPVETPTPNHNDLKEGWTFNEMVLGKSEIAVPDLAPILQELQKQTLAMEKMAEAMMELAKQRQPMYCLTPAMFKPEPVSCDPGFKDVYPEGTRQVKLHQDCKDTDEGRPFWC